MKLQYKYYRPLSQLKRPDLFLVVIVRIFESSDMQSVRMYSFQLFFLCMRSVLCWYLSEQLASDLAPNTAYHLQILKDDSSQSFNSSSISNWLRPFPISLS